METKIVDLVGIYQLTGDTCGEDLPDVLMPTSSGAGRRR
jgi:8-oxo-dGTP diphosphatase